MAGRPRRPLWKRAYTSFRHGDRRRPDAGDDPQRLTLFLTGHLLDLAESLTLRSGSGSVQSYCEGLLVRALEIEQSRIQIEAAEARHGPFEGLRAIADDPEYLAELSASVAHRDDPAPIAINPPPALVLTTEPLMDAPPPAATPRPSVSAETVIRHAGLAHDDRGGFLPSLRRGESPGTGSIDQLGAALVELDRELRGETTIDRRLAHALHRLALEAQVLHTDAWPGAFDDWTLDAIRAVQAAVERLLSGESNTY